MRIQKIYRFYVDGFRSMTVGKTLWMIILLKVFIMFAILKLFFFPDALADYKTDEEKGEHIINQWVDKNK